MTSTPRHISVTSASQGGFSTAGLPAPVEYGIDAGGPPQFVFVPTSEAGAWKVTGSGILTLAEGGISGSFSYLGLGGPGGGPLLRAATNTWRWVETENTALILPPEADGFTLEMWIDFGPNGSTPMDYVERSVEVSCHLSADGVNEAGVPSGNQVTLRVRCLMDSNDLGGPPGDGSRIAVSAGPETDYYSALDVVSANALEGIGPIGSAGACHYAMTLARDGSMGLFFNGAQIDALPPESATPIGFMDALDSFVPSFMVFYENVGQQGRERVDVSFVRYTQEILYTGSFTPPTFEP